MALLARCIELCSILLLFFFCLINWVLVFWLCLSAAFLVFLPIFLNISLYTYLCFLFVQYLLALCYYYFILFSTQYFPVFFVVNLYCVSKLYWFTNLSTNNKSLYFRKLSKRDLGFLRRDISGYVSSFSCTSFVIWNGLYLKDLLSFVYL